MKWKKIGQIFNPQIWNDGIKREWMYSHSQCTSALVFDNFGLKILSVIITLVLWYMAKGFTTI